MDSIEDDMTLLLSALRFNKDDVEQQTQTLKTLATLCSNGKSHQSSQSIFMVVTKFKVSVGLLSIQLLKTRHLLLLAALFILNFHLNFQFYLLFSN